MKLLIISEGRTKRSAVAVIQKGDKWLVGKAISGDDRHGKWCFVAGGIRASENPKQAARREAKEEASIKVEPLDEVREGNLSFVHCKYLSGRLKPNDEFERLAFHTAPRIRQLNTYKGVMKYINKFKDKEDV